MAFTLPVQIQIMQENLCELRKIAGWTAEALAEKLGITKQTISNIENDKVKLSRIQFIAIRSIIECEMYLSPENTTLRKIMTLLFDYSEDFYLQHRIELRAALYAIASMSCVGISGIQLYSNSIALLSQIGVTAALNTHTGNHPSLNWLLELLQNNESNPAKTDDEDEKENCYDNGRNHL